MAIRKSDDDYLRVYDSAQRSEGAVSKRICLNDRNLKYLSSGGMDAVIYRVLKQRNWVDNFGEKMKVHGMLSPFVTSSQRKLIYLER